LLGGGKTNSAAPAASGRGCHFSVEGPEGASQKIISKTGVLIREEKGKPSTPHYPPHISRNGLSGGERRTRATPPKGIMRGKGAAQPSGQNEMKKGKSSRKRRSKRAPSIRDTILPIGRNQRKKEGKTHEGEENWLSRRLGILLQKIFPLRI